MTRGPIVPLLLFGLAAAPAVSQVTARQGSHADTRQSFRSPMILEVPAAALLALERGERWSFPEVADYRCEDASFRSVALKRTGGAKELQFEVEGFLEVADSYDRTADVRIDLLDGERIAGGGAKGDIDAEERKTTRFWFKVKLDAAATAALRASASPTVRLTLGLRRDGLG
jgi:hypothetical protein